MLLALAAIERDGDAPVRLTDGETATALSGEPRAEVEGAVVAGLEARERVPVIVRLRDQADTASPASRARARRGGSDRLGDAASETRRVRYFRYTTSWNVRERRDVTADLFVRDGRERPVQVDSAVIELLDENGDVLASEPARRIGALDRAKLGPPPPGGYSVRALIVEAGYAVTENGPGFERSPIAAP